MQLTQTLSEGLKREFKVVLPVAELEGRLSNELVQIKDRVRINGFRPGKVPVAHIRRLYGRSIVGDLIEKAISEANQKIVDENGIRLAQQPKITLPEDKEEVNQILDVKKDLEFSVAVEILPKFDIVDVSDVELVREVADVPDEHIQEALEQMARGSREFEDKEGASATGDRLTIDFVGTIDGEEFEGGSGEGVQVEIGSNTFIPGFEEQLVDLKAGDEKTVKVAFPVNYLAPNLAGKDAEFAVKVQSVQSPKPLEIDDALAQKMGLETVEKLRETAKEILERDYNEQSRRRVKKKLLDILDTKYDFELPPTLVEQEFLGIWNQIQADMKSSNKTFEDEQTTEEAAKEEYRKIAERRVRLGLVLAEIGEKTQIKVPDEDVTKALMERVRQFPGQERQVWEFYRNNPSALAEIRAPLFEEKVVDYLLTLAKVNETKVSREELFADDEEEETDKSKKDDGDDSFIE